MQTKKTSIVSSLFDTIKTTQNFVLVQFEKTSHQTLESLRKGLKKKDTKFQVVKNTLFEKAMHQLSQKEAHLREVKAHLPLKERSAVLMFKGDWVDALKSYFDTTKEIETFKFKFGLLDKVLYDARGLSRLATLPGKDQLVAKMLGSMKNPTTRAVMAMKSPMQKLVFVLNAKSQS